jgi:hypothetical protein
MQFDMLAPADHSRHTRSILVLAVSSFSIICGFLVCHAYFWHSFLRISLRSHYNNLVVGCIVVLIVQEIFRACAAALLLGGWMRPWLCNVLGAVEVFTFVASYFLIYGFYYAIMALRYNPLRSMMLLIMSPERHDEVRWYVWFVVAAVAGAAMTIASVVAVSRSDLSPEQITLSETHFGFCYVPHQAPENAEKYSSVVQMVLDERIVPASILLLLSLGSFVALRMRVLQIKSMSFQQLWPVYVRFFGIVLFFVLTKSIQIVLFATCQETMHTVELVSAVTFPLTLGILSLIFLVSERILCGSLQLFGVDEVAESHRGFSACIDALLALEVAGLNIANRPAHVDCEESLLVDRRYASAARSPRSGTPRVLSRRTM